MLRLQWIRELGSASSWRGRMKVETRVSMLRCFRRSERAWQSFFPLVSWFKALFVRVFGLLEVVVSLAVVLVVGVAGEDV